MPSVRYLASDALENPTKIKSNIFLCVDPVGAKNPGAGQCGK